MSFRNRRAGQLAGRITATTAALTLAVLGGGSASALALSQQAESTPPMVAAGQTVGGITTVDDSYGEGLVMSQISASVLGNDTGDGLKIVSVVGATGNETGTVSFSASNIGYSWDPTTQPQGVETFIYTVQDSHGDTATASVDFRLWGPMVAPDFEATIPMTPWDQSSRNRATFDLWGSPEFQALKDQGILLEDDDWMFSILPYGETSNLSSDVGALNFNNLSKFTFIPAPGFYGTAVLEYYVRDYVLQSSQVGTVTVEVVPPQMATTAVTTFNAPVEVPVLQFTEGENVRVDDTLVIEAANGTVQIVDGVPVYTPNPGFYGVDTFTVRTFGDNPGWPNQPLDIVVSVTVLEPQVINDQTPYNTPKTVDLSETGTIETTSVDQPEHGTVEIVDGQVIYTPTPGYVGEDSFVVAGLDENGQLTSVTVEITVAPPADQQLDASTPYETPKTIDVVAETGASSVTSVGQGSNGTVEIVDGQVVYTPNPGFSGDDSFTVTVVDEYGTPITVTVDVTVGDPLAASDEVAYNTPQTVDVLGQTGAESVTGAQDGANGTVEIVDGEVVYTPNPGFIGEDTFPVTVIGEDGEPATVIVTVTVAGPDPVEIATTTPFETPKTVDVLGESGADTIASVGQGENGTAEIVDGQVVYTPNPGFIGIDEFVVTVTDEWGNPVEVTVEVTVGNVVEAATETDYNTPVTSDPVAETDGGTITDTRDGDNGTVTVNEDGTVTYTPNPGFTGEDQYTVIVTDENGDSTAVVVTVTVGEPEDVLTSAVTPWETPVVVDVLGESGGTGITGAGQGENGTVVINPDGTVTYTPNPGFTGEDEFTVTVTDEYGTPVEVVVTVTVGDLLELSEEAPYNTPKVVDVPGEVGQTTDGEHGTVTIDEDGNVVYTPNPGFVGEDHFTVIVTDEEGNPTTVDVTVTVPGPAPAEVEDRTDYNTPKVVDVPDGVTEATDGDNGTVTINPDGTVTYTPNPGFVGEDEFTVIVTDEYGNDQEITVTVTVDGPPAIEVADSTGYETPKVIEVPDGATGVTDGKNGSVTLNPDGTVTYTPNPGFSGEDSFTVTVVDEFGTEQQVIVTVTVGAPATADLATETPFETAKTIDVLGETGAESISSVTQGQNGTVTIVDGKVVYTPNPGFSGTDTFTVTVINADGTRTVVTITMTVGDPAAAPGSAEVKSGILATTGSDAGLLALVAAGAAALGGVLTMITRRRRAAMQR